MCVWAKNGAKRSLRVSSVAQYLVAVVSACRLKSGLCVGGQNTSNVVVDRSLLSAPLSAQIRVAQFVSAFLSLTSSSVRLYRLE